MSWLEAISFCNALSLRDGLVPAYRIVGGDVTWDRDASGWRLPTEREWEHLGGAGPWAGFEAEDEACRYAVVGGADGACGAEELRRVRSGAPVAGMYDLTGNAAEWVWDAWSAWRAPAGAAPSWPGADRVVKGGSWSTPLGAARSEDRRRARAGAADVGLRVVRGEDVTQVVVDGVERPRDVANPR
jgi:formylglycine-generating enzyme required for sulfatase activity